MRSRKRQRIDEDEEEDRKKEEAGSAGAMLVRDPVYYKEDGDCVVRVGKEGGLCCLNSDPKSSILTVSVRDFRH